MKIMCIFKKTHHNVKFHYDKKIFWFLKYKKYIKIYKIVKKVAAIMKNNNAVVKSLPSQTKIRELLINF